MLDFLLINDLPKYTMIQKAMKSTHVIVFTSGMAVDVVSSIVMPSLPTKQTLDSHASR